MATYFSWTLLGTVLHLLVVGGLTLRVLSKRRPGGVSMAWIILLLTFPLAGVITYLLVGETWLSSRRTKRTSAAAELLREPVAELDQLFGAADNFEHPAARSIVELGRAGGISPPLGGNSVHLLRNADESFKQLISDIDAAKRSCDLLYYIWCPGGRVSQVEEALLRARQRGVECRVMVDAVGGADLLKGPSASRLRQAGVQVRASLPVNLFRASLHRIDIRNHRKLAVLDDHVAHVGSMNMADPLIFKRNEGFGQWIDMAARIEGPSAALLGDVFEIDWAMESSDKVRLELEPDSVSIAGDRIAQVVPSGPGHEPAMLFHIMTSAVYSAQKRLTLTTPYFIPDDAFVSGLVSAALRGVEVTVVVPAKVNGFLVRNASMAYFQDLLDAGVRVLQFNKGLLHAKTVAVDEDVVIIGTVNIDRRSFWLNYELSLVLHGKEAVSELTEIQEAYISASTPLANSEWIHRGRARRLMEQAIQLLSPIL